MQMFVPEAEEQKECHRLAELAYFFLTLFMKVHPSLGLNKKT